MAYFAGSEVSVNEKAFCVVDESDKLTREHKAPSDGIVSLLTSIGRGV